MTQSALTGSPYCGSAPTPADVLWAWNGDLWLIAVFGVLSGLGGWHLGAAERARQGAFAVAVVAAVVAFISPLCALTVALFSARSLHHLVVMSVLAPALALAVDCH